MHLSKEQIRSNDLVRAEKALKCLGSKERGGTLKISYNEDSLIRLCGCDTSAPCSGESIN